MITMLARLVVFLFLIGLLNFHPHRMTFQILIKINSFYLRESLFFKVKRIKKNAAVNSDEKQMN